MERHSYSSAMDRIGWWVSEWPVLSRLVLIGLVSVVGIVMVLAMQAAYANDVGAQTTVTLSLNSFLIIIFSGINLIVLGPAAWIIRGVMRDLKQLREQEIKDIKDNHDALKEKLLTEFLPTKVHETSSERLEFRLDQMRTEINGKLERIFTAIGQIERNKADKHAFSRPVG